MKMNTERQLEKEERKMNDNRKRSAVEMRYQIRRMSEKIRKNHSMF